ncbi:MAG: VOC family protein [Schleiferiaceae bacterium]|nr:VOC family protein [Schleiferiaceae bacterium]
MKITTLKLYSKHLEKQKMFYSEVLHLPILSSDPSHFSTRIGYSKLHFTKDEKATPYHFAINIPSFQENDALQWLSQRVDLLKDGEHVLMDFENWNAKAMYFYDEDKNIVEFIARRPLNEPFKVPFNSSALLGISEVGVVTDDISQTYAPLKHIGVEEFDGNYHRFLAAGNHQGLFIIINPNIKKWFPVNDDAFYSPFELEIVQSSKKYQLQYTKNTMFVKA